MTDFRAPTPRPDQASAIEREYSSDQALAPGRYWRLTKLTEKNSGAVVGRVYLIASLKYVKDSIHTVVVHNHPAEGYGTREFLTRDFLTAFEPAHDHKEVRAAEIAELQAEMQRLTHEMEEAGRNPDYLLPQLLEELGEEAPISAPTLPSNLSTTALVASGQLTEGNLTAMTKAAEQQAALVEAKARWFEGKSKSLGEVVTALVPYYREQALAEHAKLSPVMDDIQRMLQGLQSLDLYVGKDVTVTQLTDGEGAPAEEPLYVFQDKRYVDEEIAVFTQFDDGEFDCTNASDFDKTLAATPDFIKQLLPTPRCLVLMAWRRRSKRYHDLGTSISRNAENERSWLLLRNGEKLYQIDSPIDSHNEAGYLFPTQGAMDKVFQEFGRRIDINDTRFADKLEEQDALILHFKRFLILLAGLQDREGLLGEFTEPTSPGKLLLPEVQNKVMHFVRDGEALLASDKEQSLHAWVKEKNQYLQAGSRVACQWREIMMPESTSVVSYHRDHYNWNAIPREEFGITVARLEQGKLTVSAPVEHCYTERQFNARVDLSFLLNDGWRSSTGLLCLDRVKSEEIAHFIHSRRARADYMKYLGFFKAIAVHLKAEEAHEAPWRAELLQALTEGNIGTPQTRPKLLDEAIATWRAANYGRLLPALDDPKAAKIKSKLLDQLYVLAGAGYDRVVAAEALAKTEGRTPLRLVLTGKNRLKLYATPLPTERLDQAQPQPWVRTLIFAERKTKLSVTERRWETLLRHDASETTLHEWPEAAAAALAEPAPLSYEDKAALIEDAGNGLINLRRFLTEPLDVEHWFARAKDAYARKKGNFVTDPDVRFLVGLAGHEGELARVVAEVDLLYHLYVHGDEAFRINLRAWYVSRYADKEAGSRFFDEHMARTSAGSIGLGLLRLSRKQQPLDTGFVICGSALMTTPVGPASRTEEWATALSEKRLVREESTIWFPAS